MTMYEFILPILALVVAFIGGLVLQHMGHKLDRELTDQSEEERH